ncbi:deoxyribonuclease-1-like isoform X2 [Toxotes jaculatrix]|uniref:deoxyribonuclease-1-like isoform X2 n=1 Tax=Toxotes jaculatrix TaxID=941984 RepID=UPI001B3B04B5|nr:deoxyribonuclease-1-like isoform X2 [Toxotes jaculatrix]
MRWRSFPLPLLLFSFLTLLVGRAAVSGFRICSYNVQKFNTMKAKNYRLIHTLTRIVSRCDICLLQDVFDPKGEAIKILLSSLNRYEHYSYRSVASEALGKSKEDMQQYVFIYRMQTVNVTDKYQYKGNEYFDRDPFVVQFQSKNTPIEKFILVPLHTNATLAVKEIDRLYDVFEDVSKKWNNTNVMFLGDFHASCAYLTRQDKKNIRLFTDSNFSWLIGDRVDTTVTDKTSCAYDRIVVYGQPFLKAIRPFSARVYNFAKEFKLSKTRVLEVSDHFPVEVRLKSSALLHQATPLLILFSISAVIQSMFSAL